MKRVIEKIIENLLRFSGMVTTITILLMIVFLFKEGFGLFNNSAVEKGYVLCIHASNQIEKLSVDEIKLIFNERVSNWNEIGGGNQPIKVFNEFNSYYNRYPEDQLAQKIGELISETPGMIAFLPEEFIPAKMPQVKVLANQKVSGPDFFAGMEWYPTGKPAPRFGVVPLVLGTLWVSIVAILIATPLGLGVAIFLSELASEKSRKILKPAIELLAGIPSVVYGFFGLVVLVPLVQKSFRLNVGETALTGSIILAIMALPTIISVAEDAMRSTPRAMREASLALGATHWQTIYRVIVPYAISGISAAVVLGIGRAIGETMTVLMVTGNAAIIPKSLFEPVRTIPATIAAELGEAPALGTHYQALFLLGCILFVITLVISISSEVIASRQLKPGKGL